MADIKWSAFPTIGALSTGDTLVGLRSGANVQFSTVTIPWTLANGGTNAALTASNGGIFYSTATAGAILSGTATAGQLLRSGASTAPTWSTTTYPATNAINTLLYASSANVMAALATANNGVLITSSGGVPSISSTLPGGIAATNMALTTPTLGAASATSVSFSSTSGIIGTTTNDNAAALSVGELVSSVVADTTASLTAGTVANVTSISLTAGDWDVYGNVAFQGAASTTLSQAQCWCSSTSATLPDITLRSQIFFNSTLPFSTAFPGVAFTTPTLRFSLSGTTTIYFSVRAGFAVSTLTAGGAIYARRRR